MLDDVGKENANSWAATTMFEVVNGRYERMLPTIYTSQYSFSELERRMSRSGERESAQAVLSRIVKHRRSSTSVAPTGAEADSAWASRKASA